MSNYYESLAHNRTRKFKWSYLGMGLGLLGIITIIVLAQMGILKGDKRVIIGMRVYALSLSVFLVSLAASLIPKFKRKR